MVAILLIWYGCYVYNFYFIINGFLDLKNIGIDTNNVLLSDLEAKILPKT